MAEVQSQSANFGGSLPVPSIQELTKEPLTSVPNRYIRTDPYNMPIASHHTEIPVIDMDMLLASDDSLEASAELHKLDNACKHLGFFQVINHGVESSTVEKAKQEIKGLFQLPLEEKKKLWQEPGDVSGFGQAFVLSDEQKLDWGDLFYMVTLPPHLRKPQLYSKLPQSFRETMEVYCGEVKGLALRILNVMAKALNMDANDMKELFEEGMQSIRINYYPSCPQPDRVIGLNPHSDAVGLTVLLQVNEVEGLQIKKDGMWVPVKPRPDAFVINVGDILEIVSNGKYKSMLHRAMVNSEQERVSIGTFLSPKLDGDMGPAPSIISPGSPAKFKRIGVADYFKSLFSSKYRGKSYLDALRIQDEHY